MAVTVSMLFIVPLILPVAVTLVSRIDFNARYAVTAFPAYELILAIGLVSLRPTALRYCSTAVLVILTGISLVQYYSDPSYAKEDARAAYQVVRDRLEKGDCVLVLGVNSAYRYYEEPPFRSEWMDFRSPERASRTEATLATRAQECRRLWFVSGREWEADPSGLALPCIEKYFERVDEKRLPGIRVVELRSRRSASTVPRWAGG